MGDYLGPYIAWTLQETKIREGTGGRVVDSFVASTPCATTTPLQMGFRFG